MGIFSHHGHFYTSDPNFPAKHSDYRECGWEVGEGGTEEAKAEGLETRLATGGLKHSARSFLPEGNGASERELLSFPA